MGNPDRQFESLHCTRTGHNREFLGADLDTPDINDRRLFLKLATDKLPRGQNWQDAFDAWKACPVASKSFSAVMRLYAARSLSWMLRSAAALWGSPSSGVVVPPPGLLGWTTPSTTTVTVTCVAMFVLPIGLVVTTGA